VQATREQLLAAQPKARKAIEKSVGYAVCSEISGKILLAGGGRGKGVAIDQVHKQPTYMPMAMPQPGYGMGITKSHLVRVFEREADLRAFI
jgi:lipid-binding SYLF domain-containing protein